MGRNSGGHRGKGSDGPPGATFTGGNSRGGGRGNKANDPKQRTDAKTGGSSGTGDGTGRGRVAPKASVSTFKIPKRVAQGDSRGSATHSQGTGSKPGGGTECSDTPTPSIPRSLKNLWFREGRCMCGGSSEHRKAECPNASLLGPQKPDQTPSGSSTAKSDKSDKDTKTSGKDRGVKRQRDPAPTGATPPAKRSTTAVSNTTSKPKFTYAKAASHALGIVIRNQDGSHITRSDYIKLQDKATASWMEHEQNTGESLFTVETWDYTTTYASVHVADEASAGKLEQVINRSGFLAVPKTEYLANLKPKKVLSGLLRNPLSTRSKEELERFIKLEVKSKKIPGTVEYFNETMTQQNNKILRIRVDEEAMTYLNSNGNTLSFAAYGKVLFSDAQKKKLSHDEKLSELEKKIETGKKMIAELEREREHERAAAASEAETIGSLGAGGLNLGDNPDAKGDDASQEAMETALELLDEN